MKIEDLKEYNKIENEIYERVENICKEILQFNEFYDVDIGINNISITVKDTEDDPINSLILSFEEFCSDNYIDIAKGKKRTDK